MAQPVYSPSLATVQDVIARALIRWPAEAKRIEKAATLIALGAVSPLTAEVYMVRSQTDAGVTYAVGLDGACGCQDSVRHPGQRCKHALAVEILSIARDRQAVLDRRAEEAAATAARFAALSPTELGKLVAFKREYTATTSRPTPRRIGIEGWSPR